MEPFKPGKENIYAISQNNDIQNLRQFLILYHENFLCC